MAGGMLSLEHDHRTARRRRSSRVVVLSMVHPGCRGSHNICSLRLLQASSSGLRAGCAPSPLVSVALLAVKLDDSTRLRDVELAAK